MNKLVRLLGAAFIAISVLSGVLLYLAIVNYVNVTEAKVKLPYHIYISGVRIPKIDDESQDVTVDTFFNITNPSRISIYVINIESYLYMDNLSDPRPFVEKREDLLVGVAQFTLPKENGILVRPGESVTIPVTLEVMGGTRFVSILNTTWEGKYYPIIEGTLRYTFEKVDITEVVGGIHFGAPVDPYT